MYVISYASTNVLRILNNIDSKTLIPIFGLHFGIFFHKLVWSPRFIHRSKISFQGVKKIHAASQVPDKTLVRCKVVL
jgi:hypothetical protein